MDANNEIRLRMRFTQDINMSIAEFHQRLKNYNPTILKKYLIKANYNHVWISFEGNAKRYWSPQLHLELIENDEKNVQAKGIFGPDPALWSFFMLLHLLIAVGFLMFGIIAFSNYTLKLPFTKDLLIMGVMVFLWFMIYYIARQIRKNGNGQTKELETFFNDILVSNN